MDTLAVFNAHRPLLFHIAYRMLGSAMDAEDLVQEAYLRWERAPNADVAQPKAYLAAIITRLCIDQLRSARAQRETYIGPWLPEPMMIDDALGEPGDRAALAESLSLAFLTLLETLSPVERAVFLLRDVFDYEYAEIARIVETSEANCRQLVSRARERLRARRPRFTPSSEEQQRLVMQFVHACATGDMDGLLELLAKDVTLWSDGGGKTSSALNPIYGSDRVARFLLGLARKAPAGYAVRLAHVNGRLAMIGYVHDRPNHVLWLDIADGHIQGLYNILNPDKLRRIQPLSTEDAG